MNSNTNIKQGYKQTPLGILPQEWEVVRLGEVGDIVGGGTPDTTNSAFWNGEIAWISSSDIDEESIYKISIRRFINEFAIKNSATNLIPAKSVLIISRVGVGKVAVNEIPLCTSQDTQSLILKNAHYIFMAYLIKHNIKTLLQYNQGTSIQGFTKTELKSLQIPLPPLAEQEKIAQILGVWDKGISILKSLIEAKTKRKKALMQRLLTPPKTSHTDFSSRHSDKVCHTEPFSCHTEGVARSIQKDDLQGNAICLDSSVALLSQNDRGKLHNVKNKPNESSLRFAEFTDKWQEMRLGDICEITTGSLNANAMVENGKFAFFTCAREVYAIDNYAFDTEALLVSGNGANVGYIHYYKGKFNAYQRTYVLDKFSCDILFVKFFLDKYLKKRIAQEKNEGNTPYIVLSTLQDMNIVLPNSLAEQKKIAQVLSACDKEIELLKSKFQCLKTQKKGLMQRLLNGEVRVKC